MNDPNMSGDQTVWFFELWSETWTKNVRFSYGPLDHLIKPFDNRTKKCPKSQMFIFQVFGIQMVFSFLFVTGRTCARAACHFRQSPSGNWRLVPRIFGSKLWKSNRKWRRDKVSSGLCSNPLLFDLFCSKETFKSFPPKFGWFKKNNLNTQLKVLNFRWMRISGVQY